MQEGAIPICFFTSLHDYAPGFNTQDIALTRLFSAIYNNGIKYSDLLKFCNKTILE